MEKMYETLRPILWFTSGSEVSLKKLEKYFTKKGVEDLIEYGYLKEI